MTPDEYDRHIKEKLQTSSVLPTDLPVKQTIGKLGLMWPQTPYSVGHAAVPLLHSYAREGCPVDCGEPWSRSQIEELLKRGPHRSALVKKAVIQLRGETNDKVQQGYARVVRWKELRDNLPKNLKISPIAMIPHKSKPFRAILDLSFQLSVKGIRFPSVNSATKKRAPAEAMVQLGQTLPRLIHLLAANYEPTAPFCFCKLDIKDGF